MANTEATLAILTYNDVTGTARRPLKAVFSANGDFWANYDISIAAIPSADITDGTAPEFKPTVRLIDDVTTLHLMAPANCLVSILFSSGEAQWLITRHAGPAGGQVGGGDAAKPTQT